MRKPFLPDADTMAYGYKRIDFLAFFLFPRTYREIKRLNRQIHTLINRMDTMFEQAIKEEEK